MKKIMLLSTLIFGLVTSSVSANLETCTKIFDNIRFLTILILPAPGGAQEVCPDLRESVNQFFNAGCPELGGRFSPQIPGFEVECELLEYLCKIPPEHCPKFSL